MWGLLAEPRRQPLAQQPHSPGCPVRPHRVQGHDVGHTNGKEGGGWQWHHDVHSSCVPVLVAPCANKPTLTPLHVHPRPHSRTHIFIHTHIRTHTHTHSHSHTFTRTRTHTPHHTHTNPRTRTPIHPHPHPRPHPHPHPRPHHTHTDPPTPTSTPTPTPTPTPTHLYTHARPCPALHCSPAVLSERGSFLPRHPVAVHSG